MTTRIWYENNSIQVEGIGSVPARSLYTAVDADGRVHVITLAGVKIAELLYNEYGRKDGTGFTSASAAKAYLDAEFAKFDAAAWADVTGKPSAFPPAAHTHPISDVTGLQSSLDGKSPVGHTHAYADITGRPSSFPPSAHTHLWADITDKPTTFPPSTHTHAGLWQFIGNLNVSETLLVSLAVGMKRKTFALSGVGANDALAFIATGAPTTGCEVVNVYPAGAGQVSVGYYTPLLGIGATYTMPIAVYRVTT